jgi:hypothetical protein
VDVLESVSEFETPRGPIPTPDVQVFARFGGWTKLRRLAMPQPRRGGPWWKRILRPQRRRAKPFVLGERGHAPVPSALLGGRNSFWLIDAEGARPRLNLLPGMRGEIEIGVCRVSIESLLRDPALRHAQGHTSYLLPNGVVARVSVGELELHLSVGGPSLEALAEATAAAADAGLVPAPA